MALLATITIQAPSNENMDIPCQVVASEAFIDLHPGRRLQLVAAVISHLKALASQGVSSQITPNLHHEPGTLYSNIHMQVDESAKSCEVYAEMDRGWLHQNVETQQTLLQVVTSVFTELANAIAKRDLRKSGVAQ